ncbi:Sulfotransferase family cytosolic 1B member 1, partial [Araneus ventricosus]
FLELTGAEVVEKMKRPGTIKFHLPFHMTPWSPEAKYIFVARNPKDCCVSFYHHTKNASAYGFADGEFGDFLELFINGETDFGDYFDTTLSWWERRNDPNVLFITYEELKQDTEKNVLKIASFIGSEYKEKLEKDEKMLQDVIRHSSFDFMKEHLNKLIGEIRRTPKEMIQDNPDIPAGFKAVLLSHQRQKERNDSRSTFIRKGQFSFWMK